MGLTRLAIERPLTVLMGILALVLMGSVAYTFLKIDRLPPLSYPFVSVVTTYPQAAAQDIEQLVTKPIEDTVAGVGGIQQISSTSEEGQSTVRIQFVEGTDANIASLEVQRRVASIRSRLPVDAQEPSVRKADPSASPVMNIALTGGPLDQLYDIATTQMQPALQSVLGVANVNVQGGIQREIQVKVDYSKLAAYNISVSQISTALTGANVSSTVGTSQQGSRLLDIRTMGNFQDAAGLREVVVAQTTGGPVLLRDVAVVEEGYKERRQIQRLDGQDAVGLSIVKDSAANGLQVADDVRAVLDRMQVLLPEGTSIRIRNDDSVYTRSSLHAVQFDLGLAILLVGIVIMIFLHAWRNALIILLAIPTSLISTLLVMYLFGFSLNIMTLMALALMIGILVDDSIVVIENIHRHLQMGETPREAAFNGRREIGLAALAITFADVVVYVPIAFMSGFVGQLFRQYGLTVVTATLFSLLISFTLTPMLASRWMKHEEDPRGPLAWFGKKWDAGFDRVAATLEYIVPRAIKLRWLVFTTVLILVPAVLIAVTQFRAIGTEYVPAEDAGNFNVNMSTPPGTSMEATDDRARDLETLIGNVPEVTGVFSNVRSDGGGGQANISVQLVSKTQRGRDLDEIMEESRSFAREIPGVQIRTSVPSPIGGAAGSGNVVVNVSGPELSVVNELATQVQAVASTVEGLGTLQNNSVSGTPELHIVLDPIRMAQLGVTAQQATDALRVTLGGRVVTVLRPPGKVQQDITVIASDVDRRNLTNLGAIPVRGGATAGANIQTNPVPVVTLGQIATISSGTGPVRIDRVDRNRTISLQGTATGRPLGDVANDLNAAIQTVTMPAGYSVSMRGSVNQLNQALSALGQAIVLSIILEYMLLVALYGSLVYPLVLMFAVPLGIVGSLAALYITGNTINIFSLIGLIMAFGLVAKNGILLVDLTNNLRRQGMERTAALATSARTRLRPILMTSATMVCGMFPLALKLEDGAESRAPMAVVVIGAIATSTLLAIVVIPSVYTIFDDFQGLFSKSRVREPARAPAPARVPAEGPGMQPEPVPVTVPATLQAAGSSEGMLYSSLDSSPARDGSQLSS